MNKITFGKTGLSVSTLGFGGAPIGFLQTDADRVAALLNTLLDAGVNFIDTAAAYAGSEEMIGKLVASRRDQLVLVSKCGQPSADLPGEAWSESRILATVDRTLKRLHTDRLDVMLLHSCDLPTLKKGEALGALVKAKNAGKIKFAGYSGDNQAAAFADMVERIASHADRAAFTSLFAYYAPRVKGYLMRLGLGPAESEEVCQEVMVAVWRKAASFDRRQASVATWIFRIARNRRIDATHYSDCAS